MTDDQTAPEMWRDAFRWGLVREKELLDRIAALRTAAEELDFVTGDFGEALLERSDVLALFDEANDRLGRSTETGDPLP